MASSTRLVPLLVNRGAGLGRARRAEARIVECLAALGVRVRVLPTASPAQASEACAGLRDVCDRILLAGGDGTIHSVLPRLAGSATALAILPVGMANAAARELGIPLSIEGMCKVAVGDRVRSIDLGCANGRPFVLMAGIGFDASVVRAVNPTLKRHLGPAAYVATAMALAPRASRAHIEVTHDAGVLKINAWLAVVANASCYTYHWKAVPHASPDDGLLDLCAFRSCGPVETLGQIAAALRGRHLSHRRVISMRAPAFAVTADPPLLVQLDGDAAGATPLKVTTLPRSLRVLVP